LRKNLQTRNTKIFREAPLGPSWLTLFCQPPMPTIIVRGKGVVGDKNILDIIDAQTRAMEGLDTTAALWSAADKARRQRLRTYLGKPAKLGRARIFSEKSLGVDDPWMDDIPTHFDELQT
jgi:hypothetical protein